jgi:hypothetical protein
MAELNGQTTSQALSQARGNLCACSQNLATLPAPRGHLGQSFHRSNQLAGPGRLIDYQHVWISLRNHTAVARVEEKSQAPATQLIRERQAVTAHDEVI